MERREAAGQTDLGREFQAQAEQELRRLEAELQKLDDELAERQRVRSEVAKVVGHLRGLQGSFHINDATGTDTPDTPTSNGARSSADMVVAYLEEIGKPAHYREIYEALSSRGVKVGGKDPANTLLARYFNDPRLTRVGRGTYALKG